jgi:hypothetical protein
VKREFALLVLGLVGVLLAAGQLARAAAGPGPNDVQDSLPAWAADGVHIAFERTAPGLEHVLVTTSAGKDTHLASDAGEIRGYLDSKLLIQIGSTAARETTSSRVPGRSTGSRATASTSGDKLAVSPAAAPPTTAECSAASRRSATPGHSAGAG